MTTLAGISYYKYLGEVALGRNDAIRLRIAYPLCASLFWLTVPLVVFLRALVGWERRTLCPPNFDVNHREWGFYLRFSVGARNEDSLFVSHLLFAYDTLILLCSFVLKQVQGWKLIWLNRNWLFLAMSNMNGLARIMGCRVSSLPMKYLSSLWVLHSRLNLFGRQLLRKWRED
jgi:hypothetical protein